MTSPPPSKHRAVAVRKARAIGVLRVPPRDREVRVLLCCERRERDPRVSNVAPREGHSRTRRPTEVRPDAPRCGAEFSSGEEWIYFNSQRGSTRSGHAQLFRIQLGVSESRSFTEDREQGVGRCAEAQSPEVK